MANYRVVATEKEPTNRGGAHAHVAALCLEDGRRLTKHGAMARLQAGLDAFHIDDSLQVAIRVVDTCPQCGRTYLGTDRDSPNRARLLGLPDC